MNPDLAKAWDEIEQGADRQLKARRAEFAQLQKQMGDKQQIVSHIEKKEEPEQVEQLEDVQAEKVTEQEDTTTTEDEGPSAGPCK